MKLKSRRTWAGLGLCLAAVAAFEGSWTLFWIVIAAFVLIAQWWTFIFQYLYFLRFSLASLLVLCTLPYLAKSRFLSGLLGNLFVLHGWQPLYVGLLAVSVAWTLATTCGLTYLGLAKRNQLNFVKGWSADRGNPFPAWLDRWFPWLAVPLVLPTWNRVVTDSESWPDSAFRMFLAGAVLAVFARLEIGHLLGKVGVKRWLEARRAWLSMVAQALMQLFRFTPGMKEAAVRGFGRTHLTRFNHEQATCVFIVWFLLYGLLGLATWPAFARGSGVPVFDMPALGYLLLLIAAGAQALSFLAFALDVFRVPVLTTLLLWCCLASWYFGADHYYSITETAVSTRMAGSGRLLPEVVQRKRCAFRREKHPNEPQRPMVVVTASGGGISAALWTAHVLSELDRDPELSAWLPGSIALVSTVSGGGVGAMHFVDAYTNWGPPTEQDALRAECAAAGAGLDASAWGLAYPDLLRGLLPCLSLNGVDRAVALESRWSALWTERGTGAGRTLHDWRTGVGEGWRPAQVFNATEVETGERILLTPMDWDGSGGQHGARSFRTTYLGEDMEVVTAARLSASFPFVTPVSRASAVPDRVFGTVHLGDGGYFDNFGTLSAVEFIDRVLGETTVSLAGDPIRHPVTGTTPPTVIVIQIRLFDGIGPGSSRDGLPVTEDAESIASSGWGLQLGAPMRTLLSVRTAAQQAHSRTELQILEEKWAPVVKVQHVTFSTVRPSPLSWQLTKDEIGAIMRDWGSRENASELVVLRGMWK